MSQQRFATSLKTISIKGPDATAFIQNLFCNDISTLHDGAAQLSGLCNVKGRVIANGFFVVRADGFGLLTHASLSPIILARLNMYKLRSQVTLAISDQPVYWSPEADKSSPAFAGQYRNINLYSHDGDVADSGLSAWDNALLEIGLAILQKETSEQLVPQMLNMDLLDGVSFKKGCYPGQEIVARLHFLGKLKQRSHTGRSQSGATDIAVGDNLFPGRPGESSSLGLVTHTCSLDEATGVLISIKDSAVESEPLITASGSEIRIRK